MQHLLKALSRAARTEVVPSQLFAEFLVSVDNTVTTFDLSF
jgi:hypothetical protein